MIKALSLTLFLCISLRLSAQPAVSSGGILNVASYGYAGLPNGSIAQGSIFVVFGTNLGTDANNSGFPLSATLANTSIQIASGSTTVNAWMIYTTPTQVAAILPSNTPTGSGTLKLTYNGQSSSASIQVVPSSFGIFTWNQGGSGPGIIQNYVSSTSAPTNSVVNPATPGQVEIIWGTGLGPVDSSEEANKPLPGNMQSALNVQVWVGDQPATVLYAGRTSQFAGEDQINFVVPQGVQGCYLPVAVKAGTAGVLSNFTSMSVASAAGGTCSDADGISSSDITKLESNGSIKLGVIDLNRIALTVNAGSLGTISRTSDSASAIFGQYSTSQMAASLGVTQSPSPGTCTVTQFLGLDPLPNDPVKPTALDAGGSISLTGPNGNKPIASTSTGVYSATLGGVPVDQLLTGTAGATYLDPGSYTLTGSGGSAVGSFSEQFTVPSDITWTNSSSAATINPANDLPITWSGGTSNEFVEMTVLSTAQTGTLGPGSNTPGNAVLCVAPASAGSFTIPSFVLQALTPSTTGSLVPTSYVLVGAQSQPVNFSASGLDDGYILYRNFTGTNVTISQ